MAVFILPFLLSFIIVYLSIPLLKKWALKYRFVDWPSARKNHGRPVPLTGGMAMFAGCSVCLPLFLRGSGDTLLFLAGSVFVMGIGLLDDWWKSRGREFSPWPRLAVHLAAAVFLFGSGLRFAGVGLPGGGYLQFPYPVSFLATALWIVGIVNMINLLDGADGLAGGVVAISGIALFFIAFYSGRFETAMMTVILIGATLGFLRHNFYPASVFMGDAGATFLGYSLAFISLDGTMKSATLLSVLITMLAIGVPIIDTLQVVFSRLKRGVPIHRPDHMHVHHRLLSFGFDTRQTVMILYIASIGFSLLSLLILFYLQGADLVKK